MKILYINAVCGVGSTGRIVTDLMKEAKQQGHTVKVACSTVEPIRNADPEDVIIVGSKIDYYVHNALSRLTDHEGLYSKAATKKLIRQIREYDPDLIHLHNLHGHWINYELLFKYLAAEDKKVIWTLHDCWAFTGHCTHFISYQCEKWKTQCSSCKGLGSYPKCYGKGDVSNNFNKKCNLFTSLQHLYLITPSNWLAEIARQSYLKKYQILAIANGIDLDVFKPVGSTFKNQYGIQDKRVILGVTNVWSAKKGLEDIFKLQTFLDGSYCIVLVGVTEEQLRNLPEGIIGITRVQEAKQLAEIYSSADVFINPSYEETMGLVTAEALACGTPAVVYDQTAVPEVIDEGCGIVVHTGNIEMMYEAIKTIVNSSTGMNDRAIARGATYDKHKKYSQYLALYERALCE